MMLSFMHSTATFPLGALEIVAMEDIMEKVGS